MIKWGLPNPTRCGCSCPRRKLNTLQDGVQGMCTHRKDHRGHSKRRPSQAKDRGCRGNQSMSLWERWILTFKPPPCGSLLKVSGHAGIQSGLQIQSDWYKGKCEYTEHMGKCYHVRIWLMPLKARTPRLPVELQNPGEIPEGTNPATHSISASSPKLWDNTFLLLKPHLWYFVTSVPGNSYIEFSFISQ